MIALVTMVVLGMLQAQGVVPPVRRGVVVQPESVTVGDPFRVIVRVRAPRGAVIEFPAAPDSGTGVEPLDPVQVVHAPDSSATEQTATYRLAAWDTGKLPIRFPDVLVKEGNLVRRLSIGPDVGVQVGSVLPADSAQRIPKAPRAVFEFGPPWWLWLLVALAALTIGLFLFWWWRRRAARPPAPALTPVEVARHEFGRIEALQLVIAGERGQHAALMTEVLRTYLAQRIDGARGSLTTTELAQALRAEPRVPVSRITRLLHDVDLVKFAGQRVEAERATEIGAEARDTVDAVESALRVDTEQAAAA